MKAANKLVPFTHEIDGVTFNLKPLSGIEVLEYYTHVEVLDNGDVKIGIEAIKSSLKHGLTGWNLKDDKGDAAFVNVFEKLYAGVIKELSMEILNRSELTGEDTKK